MAGRPVFMGSSMASSTASTGPMPSTTLPSGGGGSADFHGGQLGHRLASTEAMVTVPAASLPPPAVTQGSSTFAKTVYRPEYWRQWTEEAVVATDAAMRDKRKTDAANQRRRLRGFRLKKGPFDAATARGVRRVGTTNMGDGPRFAAAGPGYESLHYGGHGRVAGRGSTMGGAPREEPARVISKAHANIGGGTGATVSPASYMVPGGMGSQLLSTAKSAPSFSLGGGPSRSTLGVNRMGPGPAYNPRLPPGPSAPMTSGQRSSFRGVGDTPGPTYDPVVPSGAPAYSMGKSLRDPKDARRAREAKAAPAGGVGRDPGPTPVGFGYGCSLEEHIKYGQCLDGLCSSRANWEAVATRQHARKPKPRRRKRASGLGLSSMSTLGAPSTDTLADGTFGGSSVLEEKHSALFGDSTTSPVRVSQIQSLLDYSQAPSALRGDVDALSEGSSVAHEEDTKGGNDFAKSMGASTAMLADDKGASEVVMRIPADSEAPFSCFPMECMQCGREVPLRSPVRRVMLANKRVVRRHRELLESTVTGSNSDLLRTFSPPARATGGAPRRRAPRHEAAPPVLFLPGGGYMCSPACLKKFVLSKASPEVAKVTKGRNTRRIALLDAVKHNELEVVSNLLVSGAHINIADRDGKTPLHLACELGDPVLVDRLLHGAFNVLTFTNCQALHQKACRCFNQRPDLDKKDLRGYTPLHSAAATGKIGIVEKLVAAGADSQAEDNGGMAPQDVAGSQACFAILRLNSRVVQDGDRLRSLQLREDSLHRTLGSSGFATTLGSV